MWADRQVDIVKVFMWFLANEYLLRVMVCGTVPHIEMFSSSSS